MGCIINPDWCIFGTLQLSYFFERESSFLCMRILFYGWSDWTSHDQSTPRTIRIFSRVFGIQFGDTSLHGSRPIARTKPATDKHAHRQTEGYTIPEVFVDSSLVTNSRKTHGHISFYTTSHWGQPHEATVVKMAPTRPLASRSFLPARASLRPPISLKFATEKHGGMVHLAPIRQTRICPRFCTMISERFAAGRR